MKSKLNIGLLFLAVFVLSASLGYIMGQIRKGHEAESAFQSLSQMFSETEDAESTEAETQETTAAEESSTVLPGSTDDLRPLPIKNPGHFQVEFSDESTSVAESESETDSPSIVVTEPETVAATPSPEVPTRTEEAAVPTTAASVLRGYKGIANCVGWIRIDGTAINYPVMQSKDDPEFYLHHAVSGEYSYPGVPFLDARCKLGVSNQLVIYGHNMKNGTMFHNLRYYASKDYWQSHRYVTLDIEAGNCKYEVMSVIQYDAAHDAFRFNAYTEMDEDTFAWFLQQVRARQIYETGVTASYGDELLTLSTCDWTYDKGRLLIIARRASR